MIYKYRVALSWQVNKWMSDNKIKTHPKSENHTAAEDASRSAGILCNDLGKRASHICAITPK